MCCVCFSHTASNVYLKQVERVQKNHNDNQKTKLPLC